jgi:predicted HTH transcriptional regulator
MFESIPLNQLSEKHLQSLIDNEIREGRTIDYKEKLETDAKEFAKDVTSLANTLGGIIIYGVVEERDADGQSLRSTMSNWWFIEILSRASGIDRRAAD